MQQPHVVDIFGFWLVLFPAVWAVGICSVIGYVCDGVTRMLRLSLFASVILSVLAGNIWGFRSFVMQEMADELNQQVVGPDLVESIKLYFAALPNSWQGEVELLLAGVVGAWIGLRFFKREETIDVQ
jgi:hypothetical protein